MLNSFLILLLAFGFTAFSAGCLYAVPMGGAQLLLVVVSLFVSLVLADVAVLTKQASSAGRDERAVSRH